ncbi:MAG: peptidylprolyl isomerase [Gammaproteobacteria bacterium]|nr:peptidylprolyl isomerase [Gammaproteobacteria bacterium]
MKVRKILPLILTSLIAVLTLVGCSAKTVFSEKDLKSFTLTRTVGEDTLVITKEDNAYVTVKGEGDAEEKHYYLNYASKTFELTKKTDTVKVPTGEKDENDKDITEEKTYEYVVSASSESTVASYYKTLVALKSLKIEGDSLKVGNEFISQYLDGVLLDKVTDAKKAFDRGLLTVKSVVVEKSGRAPKAVTIKVEYASKEVEVKYSFSNVNSTKVEVLKEGTYDKDYKDQLSDSNPVVTISFKGIGEVKVQLFKDFEDSNVVKYFLYLLKEKFYKKAVVDEVPTTANGIKFGKNENAPEKTVTVDSSPAVKNKRGTLSMVVVADSKNTSQLILNTSTNTTYDSNAYTPVGGVVEGFEILDALMGLTEEEFAKVTVKITVDYKGYTYSEPSFK